MNEEINIIIIQYHEGVGLFVGYVNLLINIILINIMNIHEIK